ncbi:hypothetical protein [Streptomyces sp. 142MFCol3.1]|nr:hypothetical protein [Streptomyces sp. 142MFCol3.1]
MPPGDVPLSKWTLNSRPRHGDQREQLHGMVVYGADARALIVKAVDALH